MTLATVTTLNRFQKNGGDLHRYSRRFHSLPIENRRIACQLIVDGVEVEKAIRRAKNAATCACGAEMADGAERCDVCNRVFQARRGYTNRS